MKQFLGDFSISYGRRLRLANADVSVYMLEPDSATRETFGFEHELLLIYSRFPDLQDRVFQAAEIARRQDPFRGRVEPFVLVLVSGAKDAARVVDERETSIGETIVTTVPFSVEDLAAAAGDAWSVRNRFRERTFSRDLFEVVRRPVVHEGEFFGRQAIVASMVDAVRRRDNRGLWGLRKTGKTSVLQKMRHMLTSAQEASVAYINCETPEVYHLRWWELLDLVATTASVEVGEHRKYRQRRSNYSHGSAARVFADDLERIVAKAHRRRLVLVFDEIEYIAPPTAEASHWTHDFAPMWRVIRDKVSRPGSPLSIIIAGVCPAAVESSKVHGTKQPNPLFAMISSGWMEPMSAPEVRTLVRTLSRRMGIHFEEDAYRYVHERYGGHPMLTRLACSWVHRTLERDHQKRPVSIKTAFLQSTEAEREAELVFYCEHILDVLERSYPAELAMLEMLADPESLPGSDVLKANPTAGLRLEQYRLIASRSDSHAQITIPVIADHLRVRHADSLRAAGPPRIVPPQERDRWVKEQCTRIAGAVRYLDRVLAAKGAQQIVGIGLVETDFFMQMPVAMDRGTFLVFANAANRTLVEGPLQVWDKAGSPKHLDNVVKAKFPKIWLALDRVRVYRNEADHVELKDHNVKRLVEYTREDFGPQSPDAVPESWFVKQQRTLERLRDEFEAEIHRQTR